MSVDYDTYIGRGIIVPENIMIENWDEAVEIAENDLNCRIAAFRLNEYIEDSDVFIGRIYYGVNEENPCVTIEEIEWDVPDMQIAGAANELVKGYIFDTDIKTQCFMRVW